MFILVLSDDKKRMKSLQDTHDGPGGDTGGPPPSAATGGPPPSSRVLPPTKVEPPESPETDHKEGDDLPSCQVSSREDEFDDWVVREGLGMERA